MSWVEKCWMVTSKISVIALLMITGIYFGKFVCPYIKKKKGLWQSVLFILRLCLFYIWFRHRLIIFRISDWSYSSVSCNVCRGQKKYISENISCNYVLFYPMVNGCNGSQTWWSCYKSTCISEYECRKVWLQYGLYVGTRVWILYFVLLLLRLQ